MYTPFDIVRRIASRLKRMDAITATGAIRTEAGASVRITDDRGRRHLIEATIFEGGAEHPAHFQHIPGSGRDINPFRLAGLAAKALAGLKGIVDDGDPVEPWHADGIGSIVVRDASGLRHLVRIREISCEEEIDGALAAKTLRDAS